MRHSTRIAVRSSRFARHASASVPSKRQPPTWRSRRESLSARASACNASSTPRAQVAKNTRRAFDIAARHASATRGRMQGARSYTRGMVRDTGSPGAPSLLVADARPADQGAVRCPHFGPCGGCTFLDRPYAEELAFKEDAFRRVAEARL